MAPGETPSPLALSLPFFVVRNVIKSVPILSKSASSDTKDVPGEKHENIKQNNHNYLLDPFYTGISIM